MGIIKYIKKAFTNQWNLLGMFGGVGLAVVSGRPDIVMPIVVAVELGYLGMLGTHPKFQKYVDAQEHKISTAEKAVDSNRDYRRMIGSLSKSAKKRFEELRNRCSQLRKIADDLKHTDQNDLGSLEELKQSGLARLLWIHLKLLSTEQSMRGFFEQTDVHSIDKEIERVRRRLEHEQAGKARHRMIETLQDSLSTCELRRENYARARENYELVELELQRLENKIHSLCEMGVNQRDPDFITGQVDGVAQTMLKAHDTINELEFITGLHSSETEEVPDVITGSRKRRVKQ